MFTFSWTYSPGNYKRLEHCKWRALRTHSSLSSHWFYHKFYSIFNGFFFIFSYCSVTILTNVGWCHRFHLWLGYYLSLRLFYLFLIVYFHFLAYLIEPQRNFWTEMMCNMTNECIEFHQNAFGLTRLPRLTTFRLITKHFQKLKQFLNYNNLAKYFEHFRKGEHK